MRPPPISTLFPYTTLFRSMVARANSEKAQPVEQRTYRKSLPRNAGPERAEAGKMHEHEGNCSGIKDVLTAERSEEHTSELQSLRHLVCRLLLEKKTQYHIK